MKKQYLILTVFLAMVLLLSAGCAKSADDVLKKAVEKAEEAGVCDLHLSSSVLYSGEDASAFDMDYEEEETEEEEDVAMRDSEEENGDAEGAGEGFKLSVETEADVTIVRETSSMKAELNVLNDYNGEQSPDAYSIYVVPSETEGEVQVYTGSETFWMQEVAETSYYASLAELVRPAAFLSGNENASLALNSKTEEVNGRKAYVFEGNLEGDALADLYRAVDCITFLSDMGEEPDFSDLSAPVRFLVFQDTKEPASLEIDFLKVMEASLSASEEESIKAEKATVVLTYDSLSETGTVEVPAEAIENAMTIDEIFAGYTTEGEEGEDAEIEWEENGAEEEAVPDTLLDSEDAQMSSYPAAPVDAPAAVGDWFTTYCMLEDGTYFQVAARIVDVSFGEEVKTEAETYLAGSEDAMLPATLSEGLEYGKVTAEVYVPTDFPEESFAGVEMYLTDETGTYFNNDDYEFTDLFWIEMMEADAIQAAPGETVEMKGIFTIQPETTAFRIEVGDSWGNESYAAMSR